MAEKKMVAGYLMARNINKPALKTFLFHDIKAQISAFLSHGNVQISKHWQQVWTLKMLSMY